ncbi:17087_t:CDS:2, partial [Funneliformis geosporum]
DWTIEEKEETKENFIYFNWKALLECPLCKRIHDKNQSDELGDIFECDPFIAEKIQQKNKNISSASSICKIKDPGFPKVFIKFPSWVQYNDPLIATETYKERYHLTISDDVNLLVLSTRHSYSNAVTTRLNLKLYYDIDVSIIAQAQSRLAGQSIEKLYKLIQEARHIIPQKGKTFRLVSNKETVLAELWDWAKKMISLPIENRKSASLICYLRKDVQGIVRAFKTNFPKLRIKEYHDKSDLEEKAHDFSN